MKMKELKQSNCEIARKLGVTEGTIRYHLKRQESGKIDGRKLKASELEKYADTISRWVEHYRDSSHRPVLKVLYERLKEFHGYNRSYDALRRYVRKHYPEFAQKSARLRIETPPGQLVQVDWKEDIVVEMGWPGNLVKVHALICTLGFSRKSTLAFCEKKDLDSFLHGHQRAFSGLGGLVAYVRPDCLKSAIVQWKGEKSIINGKYQNYLSNLEIDVFPSRPGVPRDKGKVEKRIRDLFDRLALGERVFQNMADLQSYCERKLDELQREWRCGATGLSVAESFEYEKQFLRPLPERFPQLPAAEKHVRVRNDCTVYFLGNYYQVERKYKGKTVLCTNNGQEIVIYYDGRKIGEFSFLPKAKGMVALSQQALIDPELHISPTVREWALDVARRQVSIYHEIIQGGMN
jgi:transposase